METCLGYVILWYPLGGSWCLMATLHSMGGTWEEGFLVPLHGAVCNMYLREARVRLIFRASASALAPWGPMQLLRRLVEGREREKTIFFYQFPRREQGTEVTLTFKSILLEKNVSGQRISCLMELRQRSICRRTRKEFQKVAPCDGEKKTRFDGLAGLDQV